jgi:hypothetical protein
MVTTSTGSAARAGTNVIIQQRHIAMAVKHRLRPGWAQTLPLVIRIVSGIHACPIAALLPVGKLKSQSKARPDASTSPSEPPANRSTLPLRRAEP